MKVSGVLLIFLDCLRKDRLSKMPRLRRVFSGDGWTELTRHYSAAHCSDPNFMTLLTGALPDQHGVKTQMGAKFTDKFSTLQRRLHEAGWRTWAYEPVKVPAFYRDGFDELLYHSTADVSPSMMPGPKAAIQRAQDFGQPWFGFMRVMDTHYPYNGEPLPEDRRGIPRQYDRAVAHIDRAIAHLVSWVLSSVPDTLVVVGADHGELLGEDGLWDHLFTLRPELVRVPMFIHVPGVAERLCTGLTQHPLVANAVLGASGLEETSDWRWLQGDEGLPQQALPLTAWGTAARDEWKHWGVVFDADGKDTLYTVDWKIGQAATHSLFVDGQPSYTLDLAGMALAGLQERYPAMPNPRGLNPHVAEAAGWAKFGDGEWE